MDLSYRVEPSCTHLDLTNPPAYVLCIIANTKEKGSFLSLFPRVLKEDYETIAVYPDTVSFEELLELHKAHSYLKDLFYVSHFIIHLTNEQYSFLKEDSFNVEQVFKANCEEVFREIAIADIKED